MAYEMSFEVLDGEFPARLWMEAHGDSLVEAALQCDVVEWRWQHFGWGTVLEIDFADEAAWERFRASPAVQAALDAVPDRVSGLMIYRGRGGTSAPREPRRPRPLAGAGAAALEFPEEWVFEPVGEVPHRGRPVTVPGKEEWQDWSQVVAADLADPAFRALVGEIDADQEAWAGRRTQEVWAVVRTYRGREQQPTYWLRSSQAEAQQLLPKVVGEGCSAEPEGKVTVEQATAERLEELRRIGQDGDIGP